MKIEMRMKEFLLLESERRGVSLTAIHNRLTRGLYPDVKCRQKNSRVVFVRVGRGFFTKEQVRREQFEIAWTQVKHDNPNLVQAVDGQNVIEVAKLMAWEVWKKGKHD